jgi:hypothetical protein
VPERQVTTPTKGIEESDTADYRFARDVLWRSKSEDGAVDEWLKSRDSKSRSPAGSWVRIPPAPLGEIGDSSPLAPRQYITGATAS